MRRVCVIGFSLAVVTTACVGGRTPETRTTLPRVTVAPGSSTPAPDPGPLDLRYKFNAGEITNVHSIADLDRKTEIVGEIDAEFAQLLKLLGFEVYDGGFHVTGPLDVVSLEAKDPTVREVVAFFHPNAGEITVRRDSGAEVAQMTQEELVEQSSTMTPFLVDDRGGLVEGLTGAPRFLRARPDPVALLNVIGPALPEKVVQLGDEWNQTIEIPGASVEITLLLERAEFFDNEPIVVISLTASGASDGPIRFEDLSGRIGTETGEAFVNAGLQGTLSVERFTMSGEVKFDPALGRIVESSIATEHRIVLQLGRAGDAAPVTVIDTSSTSNTATVLDTGQATLEELAEVLGQLTVDPNLLASVPFFRLGEYELHPAEEGALAVLNQAIGAIAGALQSPVAQTVVPEQGEPVTVATALLVGTARGHPSVSQGLAAVLNSEEQTEVPLDQSTAIRVEIGAGSLLLGADETTLFMIVGPAELAAEVMRKLLSGPKPYQWEAGDCLVYVGPPTNVAFAPFGELGLVHCQLPHQFEVVYSEPTPEPAGASLPADLTTTVGNTCAEKFDAYIAALPSSTTIQMIFFLPDPAEWDLGRRYIACIVYNTSQGKQLELTERLEGAGPDNPFSVAVGDCLALRSALPCSEPHDWEVIGFATSTEKTFPGAEELAASQQIECDRLLTEYAPRVGPVEVKSYPANTPYEYEWDRGVRDFYCVAAAVNEADGLSESVIGSFKENWSIVPVNQQSV